MRHKLTKHQTLDLISINTYKKGVGIQLNNNLIYFPHFLFHISPDNYLSVFHTHNQQKLP